MGLTWVFKTKYLPDESVHKHKTCLVSRGFSQLKGVDFEYIFSRVARLETITIFLALVAHLKCMVYQLDVKSSFLNRELREEVYIDQPLGFKV